jgi:hypothetical protein
MLEEVGESVELNDTINQSKDNFKLGQSANHVLFQVLFNQSIEVWFYDISISQSKMPINATIILILNLA